MKTLAEVLDQVNSDGGLVGAKVESVHSVQFSGETALHICAKWGDDEAIRVLVAHGADIDKPGEDGNTPLHYAAMLGQLAAVRALVRLGAVNARDRYGNLPIHLAETNLEVKEFLVSNGYAA